jgi:outer membrane lipoprotein
MVRKLLFVIVVSLLLYGCAHVISRDVLKEVDRKITFTELRKNPQAFLGKVVLLGGVIVKTENKEEGTLLEIYQTALNRQGRPVQTDVSEGRFLALYEGILDSELYGKGRRVTVAGTVKGEKVMKLGEIDYHYPYLVIKEIHLWREEERRIYEPYLWEPWGPWWYDPWYPWYPWYHPYWHHRHHRH